MTAAFKEFSAKTVKQKTAYEIYRCDWSSDVCSSDLRGKNAQLAYSFDIALQNEFSLEENIALARQFLLENFVSRGMVVDFAIHQPDREDGGIPNPHFHVLCPIRPIEQNGKWGLKQRRVYELDEDGNRIRDADGKFVFNAVPTTDWGSPETLEHWGYALAVSHADDRQRNSGGSDLRAGIFRIARSKGRAFRIGGAPAYHPRRGHDLPCVLRLCFHRAGRCFSTRHRSRHG